MDFEFNDWEVSGEAADLTSRLFQSSAAKKRAKRIRKKDRINKAKSKATEGSTDKTESVINAKKVKVQSDETSPDAAHGTDKSEGSKKKNKKKNWGQDSNTKIDSVVPSSNVCNSFSKESKQNVPEQTSFDTSVKKMYKKRKHIETVNSDLNAKIPKTEESKKHSVEAPAQNKEESSEISKKKKRKRKCKKNKFKDYSKDTESSETVTSQASVPLKQSLSLNNKVSVVNIDKTVAQGSDILKVENKKQKKKNNKHQHQDGKEPSMIKDQNGSLSKHTSKPKFDLKKLNALLSGKSTKSAITSTQKCPDNDTNHKKKDSTSFSEDEAPQQARPPKEGSQKSLLERSKERLNAARFRYLNEQLYTSTGHQALKLFKEDQDAFKVYHAGFQTQVEQWPTNPVDVIINQIKNKPKKLIIADFGCGDAKIARSVPQTVHSFDLVALNDHVTVCNMSKVPLGSGSVDIAVFCLSLMGTNLVAYLHEANRVLKPGGTLLVAEVTSRFEQPGKFALQVEKLGFKLRHQDNSSNMFVLMDFKKTAEVKKEDTEEIKLKPCVYKKR